MVGTAVAPLVVGGAFGIAAAVVTGALGLLLARITAQANERLAGREYERRVDEDKRRWERDRLERVTTSFLARGEQLRQVSVKRRTGVATDEQVTEAVTQLMDAYSALATAAPPEVVARARQYVGALRRLVVSDQALEMAASEDPSLGSQLDGVSATEEAVVNAIRAEVGQDPVEFKRRY